MRFMDYGGGDRPPIRTCRTKDAHRDGNGVNNSLKSEERSRRTTIHVGPITDIFSFGQRSLGVTQQKFSAYKSVIGRPRDSAIEGKRPKSVIHALPLSRNKDVRLESFKVSG